MKPITTSIFDLFKIGPGPSSSHTIAPMKICFHFRKFLEKLPNEKLNKATKIEVHLYGSLSATGKGHGTDKAVIAGLMGLSPETCDSDELIKFFVEGTETYTIRIGSKEFLFDHKCIFFDQIQHFFAHKNTIIIKLMSDEGALLEKEYYSTGGGFYSVKGEDEEKNGFPRYPYSSLKDIKDILKNEHITIMQLLLGNEEAISKRSKEEVFYELDKMINVMEQAVNRGLSTEGFLPGPLRLQRKAPYLYNVAKSNILHVPDQFIVILDSYALAASEENAAGHKVVTAPTSGASGVIPAIVYLLKNDLSVNIKKIKEGLIVAAMIGFLSKHNASISGAEVGCQGEVGVAASMGAAMLTYVNGGSIDIIDIAAEIALEHNLGMTCDPIRGYVQIPCIERNAVGTMDAYNAYLLASSGDPKKHKLNFDQVLKVMLEVGRDMCSKYKETSQGGLAVCEINC